MSAPRWLLHGLIGIDNRHADDVPLARCAEIDGLFTDQPPSPRVRLLGCQPEPPLATALNRVGASARRRHLRADVSMVAADGTEVRLVSASVSGTIVAAEPSRHGDGLFDVTIDGDVGTPLPAALPGIMAHWPPQERNTWSGYDRELRHHWAGVALANPAHAGPDRIGGTYHLDGTFVTDIEGFYCALGEAVNGPGGYFGWNTGAVLDCLHGGFGARPPFRLVWHDSAVARAHLAPGPGTPEPPITLAGLVHLLTTGGIDVELR